MNSFVDVIDRWATVAELANDLGLPKTTAYSWRQRGSIPIRHFSDVVRAASERGFHEITPSLLFGLALGEVGTVAA